MHSFVTAAKIRHGRMKCGRVVETVDTPNTFTKYAQGCGGKRCRGVAERIIYAVLSR